MKKVLFITLALIVSFNSFSQKKDKKNDKKSSYSLNMANAWLLYNNDDYYGALRVYRKLYKDYKNSAELNYKLGACLIKTYNMDSALYHLKKSLDLDTNVDNQVYLLLGQAYHYLGDIDNALKYYEKYRSKLKKWKRSEKTYINNLIRQCYTAKDLMNNPVNVEIVNMGPNINTKYTDANPYVTADGKTLIFTSRRPENIGGKIDPAVNEYYDDIYITTWNNDTHSWNPAKNIGPPINTEYHDADLSITPDGKKILLYKNIAGVTRSGDIYYSIIKDNGTWTTPKPFGNKYINSTYFESSACLTADGKTLYFVSEREHEGFGHGDIYVSHLVNGDWTKPENLGPVVNSEYDEIGVYIHPDGKTLFFSSNGHNTMGGHDIFMTTLNDNGKWTQPINMGYPINTTREEIHFVFTTDRTTAYLSSSRAGGYGKMDIYKVDMRNYFKNNKNIPPELAKKITGPPLSIIKGKIIDSNTKAPLQVVINVKNLDNGKSYIFKSKSNGDYFATLPANHKYEMDIMKKGYKNINFKFKLLEGKSKTYILTKYIFMDKEKH